MKSSLPQSHAVLGGWCAAGASALWDSLLYAYLQVTQEGLCPAPGHGTLAIAIVLTVSSDPAADWLWDSWLHPTEPQCPHCKCG